LTQKAVKKPVYSTSYPRINGHAFLANLRINGHAFTNKRSHILYIPIYTSIKIPVVGRL